MKREQTLNLKERRKALGISQINLAQKIGVSLLTLQLWERGVGNPRQENQDKLEAVLTELEKERR